jgi:hypothetical protein
MLDQRFGPQFCCSTHRTDWLIGSLDKFPEVSNVKKGFPKVPGTRGRLRLSEAGA